jgi:hypothetical protein
VPNTIAIRKLLDGPKTAVLHVYVASDGSSGELSAAVIVDASTLSGAPTKLTIEKVAYAFTGFSGLLAFDATTDVPVLALIAENPASHCFTEFGGIADTSETGFTGDILLSTTGFTAAGDRGHITITVKKN